MNMRNQASQSYSFSRLLDIFGAVLLLALSWPIFVLLFLCNLRHPGQLLYRHVRVNSQGGDFDCLKFRTMEISADTTLEAFLNNDPLLREEWTCRQKLFNDPRVTRVGKILRKSSLDELPQLFNVLRGEMSLVGPRPVTRKELEQYGDQVSLLLSVRPGMSGLSQVSGRSELDYQSRVALDIWYVQNRTFQLDCWILLKTIPTVVRGKGAY
ncbi:MAG: sugar transferase [Rhodoferax sp.]|nr:sugar transferase [Rhodoferax sp.]